MHPSIRNVRHENNETEMIIETILCNMGRSRQGCVFLLLLLQCARQSVSIDTSDVNSIWLDEYSNGKNFVVDSTPIILVGDNENFRAFEYGSRTPSRNWTVDLTLYTNLKVICHSVLGLFGTCASAQNNTAGSCETTSSSQYIQNLKQYH